MEFRPDEVVADWKIRSGKRRSVLGSGWSSKRSADLATVAGGRFLRRWRRCRIWLAMRRKAGDRRCEEEDGSGGDEQ